MERRRRLVPWVVCILGVAAITVASSPGRALSEVHLTAAGDYSATAATAAVLDEIARLDPDAHLALGDLAYGSVPTPYAWCDFVKQRVGEGFPFQLVSGNHESNDNNDGDINDFSACLPNQVPGAIGTYGRQYAMDFPQDVPLVRVIQASPNLTFENGRLTYAGGTPDLTWVSNAIDQGRARGARWIVVTSHYPCLTVGTNGCPPVRDFYDLLVEKGVDLVLHGHEHNYARTHQLHSGVPGCTTIAIQSTNPACIADADGVFGAGYGTVFATVGTGGIELRDVNPADTEAGYFAAWSGANVDPTHGVLDLRFSEEQLSAGFVRAAGGGFTDAFTITRGLPSPTTTTITTTTTSTTSTTTAPSTTLPPTTSTLPPGTTSTSTLPPGTTSTSTTSTSTLPPGTTSSSTTSTSTTTTTLPPAVEPFALDTFSRTASPGWGVADRGGTWSSSTAAAFSVDGESGVGQMTVPTGAARSTSLPSVSSADTDLGLTLAIDRPATGSGLYVSVIARTTASSDYRAVVRYQSTGRVTIRLDRGLTTIAPEVVVTGVTTTPGSRLHVRVQAVGTNPTTVQAKAWAHGTPEPAAWARSVTDSTAAVQQQGGIGVYAYLSSGATNGPINVTVDDLAAVRSTSG